MSPVRAQILPRLTNGNCENHDAAGKANELPPSKRNAPHHVSDFTHTSKRQSLGFPVVNEDSMFTVNTFRFGGVLELI